MTYSSEFSSIENVHAQMNRGAEIIRESTVGALPIRVGDQLTMHKRVVHTIETLVAQHASAVQGASEHTSHMEFLTQDSADSATTGAAVIDEAFKGSRNEEIVTLKASEVAVGLEGLATMAGCRANVLRRMGEHVAALAALSEELLAESAQDESLAKQAAEASDSLVSYVAQTTQPRTMYSRGYPM